MRRRSERQRWTQVAAVNASPSLTPYGAKMSRHSLELARAAIEAIHKTGRVVRVEPMKYGDGLIFKARRS